MASKNEYKEIKWMSKDIKLSQGFYTKKDSKGKNVFYKYSNNFYGNNGETLKDNDDPISREDFTALIKSETLNFINRNFDNVVVLFGAGASVTNNKFDKDERGIAKSGVTVSEIANEVLEQLSKGKYKINDSKDGNLDVYKLNEIASKTRYSDNILNNEGCLENFNLEDFLSNMFSYEKFVPSEDETLFYNTKKAIMDIIIKATSYNYDNKKFKHVKLLNILSQLTKPENKLNLVTTNYDTLLEDAAEYMKWTVFDGFSFSQNPTFDSTMFDWNLVKSVPNVTTKENIYKNNVVNLLKIHGSLTWEHSKSDSKSNNYNDTVRINKEYVNDPIMVFPSSNKYAQSYQEPYFDLFNKFQNLLHKPNTLFISIGFSFADNHIARMILSALQTNDGLAALITDFNIESDNDNWKELKNYMDNYYNVSFLKATLNDDLTDYMGV